MRNSDSNTFVSAFPFYAAAIPYVPESQWSECPRLRVPVSPRPRVRVTSLRVPASPRPRVRVEIACSPVSLFPHPFIFCSSLLWQYHARQQEPPK